MKKTLPSQQKEIVVDKNEIIKSKTFSGVIEAFGLTEAPEILYENLEKHLQEIKFNCPKIDQNNMRDLLFALPVTPEQRIFLVSTLVCILRDHQKKSDPELGWGINQTDKALSQGHFNFNWNHIIHELKDMAIFGVSTGKFALNPNEPNVNVAYATITSILTDAIKPEGLVGVLDHHEKAANFLEKIAGLANSSGFEKTNVIREGILKHQFNPPFIMMIILQILLKSKESTNPETLNSLLGKILNPYENQSAEDPSKLNLTPDELELLKLVSEDLKNSEGWWLPENKPNGEVPLPNKLEPDIIAQWVVIVDAMQYVAEGIIKILLARGPGTMLVDENIDESIMSILGDGVFASFGASIKFLENDSKTLNLFNILRKNVKTLLQETKETMSDNLEGDYPEGVPFLQKNLPTKVDGHGKKTYISQVGENEVLFVKAKEIKSAFIKAFGENLKKSVESGHIYEGLERLSDEIVSVQASEENTPTASSSDLGSLATIHASNEDLKNHEFANTISPEAIDKHLKRDPRKFILKRSKPVGSPGRPKPTDPFASPTDPFAAE